ncbi:Uncharacterized protein Rs2_48668 [Raphanus sativus]|nr:Uncharacterized protein Rs2_48668 [Raphanus sativus]
MKRSVELDYAINFLFVLLFKVYGLCWEIESYIGAQALRSGVAAATRCSSQLDFGFPFLLEACWMSTRREIIVTTSLSEEIAQHTLDEIEKRVEVGISPKTKEEAKQVISSLTTCLEENKVLLKDAAVALAELRASMSQPDEYVTMEKIRDATKVLQRL